MQLFKLCYYLFLAVVTSVLLATVIVFPLLSASSTLANLVGLALLLFWVVAAAKLLSLIFPKIKERLNEQ